MFSPYRTSFDTHGSNRAAQNDFDAIVIGVGSMGASTCYALAKRGLKILGLEQFGIPHQFGSHTGQSRIIRKAYFEHPDYVPLLLKAYEGWQELESRTGAQLYYPTGFLYFGPKDHELLRGVKQSANLYNLPLEHLSIQKASERFPQFKPPADYEVINEPEAGFVTPEKAILSYAEEAIKLGADLRTGQKVLGWESSDKGIKVKCESGTFTAKKLVITAGAWTDKLISGLSDKLQVTRQLLAWVKPKYWQDFTLGNFSCWTVAHQGKPGIYYGFPILPASNFQGPIGLKVAYHNPGRAVDPSDAGTFDQKDEINDLKEILDHYLPQAFESVLEVKSCFYTNTPDQHFIIDQLPGYEDNVSVACGFSGHGFKFVPVVGEALADLVTMGKTNLPIEFLNAKRFS